MATKWDFFISYTAADRAWAEWIAWQLEETGFKVLFQAWDFVPGSHWTSKMQEGITGSERTLAVLSAAYLDSVYGNEEWEAAYRADQRGFTRKLVPVRVEDCARPGLLGGIVSFDLFDVPEEVARSVLLAKVEHARAGRAKPATAPAFPSSDNSTSGYAGSWRAPAMQRPDTAPGFPGQRPEGEGDAAPTTWGSGPGDGPRRRRPSLGVLLVSGLVLGTVVLVGAVIFTLVGFVGPLLEASPDGSGSSGAGTGIRAGLDQPSGLAVGPGGTSLYVGDAGHHRVLKVDAAGFTTVASGPEWCPSGLAVGKDDALYVADSCDNRIRKVVGKRVWTIAGIPGTEGKLGDGGLATEAKLQSPKGLAIGPDGALYIADAGHARVRKIDSAGRISTVAGTDSAGFSGDNVSATRARLDRPEGLSFGPDGILYIADAGNNRIFKVENGILSTVAGTGGSGLSGDGQPATQADLNSPRGVAVGPDGAIYIADHDNDQVRMVDPTGIISTLVNTARKYGSSGDNGPAPQASVRNLGHGLVLGVNGTLYIADHDSDRVRKVDRTGLITTAVT